MLSSIVLPFISIYGVIDIRYKYTQKERVFFHLLQIINFLFLPCFLRPLHFLPQSRRSSHFNLIVISFTLICFVTSYTKKILSTSFNQLINFFVHKVCVCVCVCEILNLYNIHLNPKVISSTLTSETSSLNLIIYP